MVICCLFYKVLICRESWSYIYIYIMTKKHPRTNLLACFQSRIILYQTEGVTFQNGYCERKSKMVLTSASCPQMPRAARAPGYIIFYRPPASAVLLLIYTGASLDWRLGRGSVYNTTTYTPSSITIMYKSYNINTVQITIENSNHNPHLFPIPPKPIICFLNFVMITIYSSVTIIIIHKEKHSKY